MMMMMMMTMMKMMMMMMIIMMTTFYLFDTFKGMTEPTKKDYSCDGSLDCAWVENYYSNCQTSNGVNIWCWSPLEAVKKRLEETGYPPNRLHYVVGDVMETLEDESNIPDKIAILRLDTDWYESTKFELERMYDKVVEGGLIIFDDYFHWEGQKKATDEFFNERNIKVEILPISNHQKAARVVKKTC
jgi:hypothetical protein